MKRWLLIVALLVGATVALHAAQWYRYEQLTVAASAIGLTSTTYRNPANGEDAVACAMRLETAEIRYTLDGTTPTATVGTLLGIGEILSVTTVADAARARFFRTGSTSGVLNVNCWR